MFEKGFSVFILRKYDFAVTNNLSGSFMFANPQINSQPRESQTSQPVVQPKPLRSRALFRNREPGDIEAVVIPSTMADLYRIFDFVNGS